jgi:murein DD-endopeptidase MepM/ murein hydrolase activator NlpD
MSSAKRTPRYVEAVPRNLRIVGPTVEAQVIPIRRITPAYVPVIDAPAMPMPAPRRSKRKIVPVARRPWRVLVVSPTPGGATRSFGVARWQARIAVAGLSVFLLVGGGAVAAIVTALETPDLFVTSADAAVLREQLLDAADSLALLRTELLSAREASSDSAIAFAASRLVDGTPKPAVKPAARRPLLARAPRVAPRDRIMLAPRSIAGLPVIGIISSTFSRSRRHPILHIRRPHLGVDIAAARGTHITAPAAGKVVFVGHKFGFGLVVEVQHTPSVKTRYAHMRAATVKVGDQLARGEQIGTVGTSGITTGPHLHYEVIVNGRQVDPLRYVLPQPAQVATPAAPVAPAPEGSPSVEAGATTPDDSAIPPPIDQASPPGRETGTTPR